ncbi:MAG: 2-phosphosulfolactate phosphatase [Candidatus Dormibacteria bacterium]
MAEPTRRYGEARAEHGYRRGGGARFAVNLGWGLPGLEVLGPVSDVLVVVDVITFTTTLAVAMERGVRVYPCPWEEEQALALAARTGASLAVGRSQVSLEHPYSLKPASLARAPAGLSLVLPSPNGSALVAAAASFGVPVLAGSLRNAAAVARVARRSGRVITVIAAGERWAGEEADFALEDLLGAGAVIDGIRRRRRSPEAAAAAAAFRHARGQGLGRVLGQCVSGLEQAAKGHGDEVEWAAALNVSRRAPLLRGEYFEPG